jgi:hypothetical protein
VLSMSLLLPLLLILLVVLLLLLPLSPALGRLPGQQDLSARTPPVVALPG